MSLQNNKSEASSYVEIQAMDSEIFEENIQWGIGRHGFAERRNFLLNSLGVMCISYLLIFSFSLFSRVEVSIVHSSIEPQRGIVLEEDVRSAMKCSLVGSG